MPRLASNRSLAQLPVMQAIPQDTDILRRMSPAEKLAVMHALIRQAWELKAAAIRAQRPDLSEPAVQARAWELVGGERPWLHTALHRPAGRGHDAAHQWRKRT